MQEMHVEWDIVERNDKMRKLGNKSKRRGNMHIMMSEETIYNTWSISQGDPVLGIG